MSRSRHGAAAAGINAARMELASDIEAAQEAARRGRKIATNEALRGIPTLGGLIIVEDEWDHCVVEFPLDVA